jgi:hypothetical protein
MSENTSSRLGSIQFGRLLRRYSGRVVALAKTASIAGTKTAIDAVLNRDRASISFTRLGYGRCSAFLLFALTRIRAVGCSARDAYRAWAWLPTGDFFRKVRINWRSPSDGILLSDNTRRPAIVQIKPQYYSLPPASNRLFAPYFAHPEFYKAGLHDAVRSMRAQSRNLRIFFSGTICRSAYSENFRFPILTRDKILAYVSAKFESAIKTEVTANGSRPICIISTSDTRYVFDKHKLSLRNYMDVMSRADFFICPPGWLMPHSHNLIEAMSVGTIPITNYHSYMQPTLTPGQDCLAFSNLEELEEVINCALCMPAGEIQRLREGVISYYDEHLDPESFAKKFMKLSASISELVVNDESGR